MRSFVFAALAATIAASPLRDLLPRVACPTTSGGLTGPFYIQVSGEVQTAGDPGPNYDGDYAGKLQGKNAGKPFLTLNYPSTENSNVLEFYINGSGQLITNPTGTTSYAYLYPKARYVSLSTDPTIPGQITCSINSATCVLTCQNTAGQSTNCLGSPSYDPEWRIGAPSVVTPPCTAFTPLAVAA